MAKKQYKIKTKNMPRVSYKNIVKDNQAILREISKDVTFPLDKKNKLIINQMIDYVRSSQDENERKKRDLREAIGISAVQIGFLKKIIFVRIPSTYSNEFEEFTLVNPKIIKKSKKICYLKDGEGCLSVEKEDEIKGHVYRSYEITLLGMDHFGNQEVEINAKGFTAIVFQHEMDHLYGILYYDRINRLNPFYKDEKAIEL